MGHATLQIAACCCIRGPESLDYGTRGTLKLKGNAMAHWKMGSLKQTVWQLRAAKFRQCYCETVVRADHACRPRLQKAVANDGGNSDDFSNYCPSLSLNHFLDSES